MRSWPSLCDKTHPFGGTNAEQLFRRGPLFFSNQKQGEAEKNISGLNQANYGFPNMNQVVSGDANALVDLVLTSGQAFSRTRRKVRGTFFFGQVDRERAGFLLGSSRDS